MKYQLAGKTIGYGDDVLQLFDAVAASHVGRHQQTEALIRGDDDTDRRLVIDECAAALEDDRLTEPVRQCAREVLKAIDVDPDGAIRRLDAGKPTIERLQRLDRRQEVMDRAKERATEAASTGLDAASRSLNRVRSWLKRGQEGSRTDPE